MAKDATSQPVDESADSKPGEPVAPSTGPKKALQKEIGGVEGPEPTRYGDWEHKGRCTDF
jgi:hypothetical protein